MSQNFEMATPINSLPKHNINNLVKNVENNIRTLSTNSPIQSTIPKYDPNIPISTTILSDKEIESMASIESKGSIESMGSEQSVDSNPKNKIIYYLKEYAILVLLFSLFSHEKTIDLYKMVIKFDDPIVIILARAFTFALILFTVKKLL